MSKAKVAVIAVLCLVAAASVVLFTLVPGRDENEVIVLCGSSMRAALEDIIEKYKKVSDDNVLATYGGSGILCAQIQNTGKGHVFICHDPFMPWADKNGLIDEWATVGRLDVVIIVAKGNPKNILSLEDLAKPGLRIGLGDHRYSTSGVIAKQILEKLDNGEAILKNVRTETHGHQQLCTDVALGTLDASIVWGAVAGLFADRLEIIPIPREYIDAVTSATFGVTDLRNIKVTVGLTSVAAKRKSARRFYEFVARECADVFAKHGFAPVVE